MIDSMSVALSGMLGHERGLNVISNNVSNMNTTAFRGSTVSFADVFVGSTLPQAGGGLDASRARVDFRPGERQPTGGELDLMLSGDGFFVVQDEQGEIRYTRAGAFDFNDAGELVLQGQNVKVMTRNASGQLVPLTLQDLRVSAAKPTTTVRFKGNLHPDDTEHTLDPLVIFDQEGRKHSLRVVFTKDTAGSPGLTQWNVKVFEGEQEVGADTLQFTSISAIGQPLRITLSLPGIAPAELVFDFSFPDVTGQSLGASGDPQSDLSVKEQDGFDVGTLTARSFDEKGVLKLTYSNGRKADGPKLVLAQISDRNGLVELGNSRFAYRGTQAVALREAGDDLQVVSGALERSNVNLTQEFSELILMQRGYQASSQVLSTANDMLQQLFDMRGRR